MTPKKASKTAPNCPICGKTPDPHYRPFCSARCEKIDLGNWLGERYAVPADMGPDGDAEGASPAPANDRN